MKIPIKKGWLSLVLSILMLFSMAAFTGCGGGDGDSDSSDSSVSDDSSDSTTTDDSSDSTTDDSSDDTTDDSSDDITIDVSGATTITLNKTSITVDGDGVTVSDAIAVITSAGTYNIIGTLTDGQIKVSTSDTGDVNLYLNGVDITSSEASPIDIESAERVVIYLADGTDNFLTDGTTNTSLDEDGESIDATLFSKDDLLIAGTGSLTVDANNNNAIKSKDSLVIENGVITVTSVDDGIIGKNYIKIKGGDITVDAEGDGMKSTEDEETDQGYIDIEDGVIDITAGADALQVETSIVINGGEFYITSGGGSKATLASDATAKGLKAPVGITINDGDFTIDSADDAIHSNGTITITGGTFAIATGDDGIHADTAVQIDGGEINISEAYEGIEGMTVTINDGEIHVSSDDDPINATDGTGQTSKVGYLYINGGYIYVECESSDGLDSNGMIEMTDGLVIINGPASGDLGILDYNTSFTMNGGTIIGAAGDSNMAQAPGSNSSAQYALLFKFSQQTAGTLFHIETSSGEDIVTFKPAKAYASIAFSSPDLSTGSYVYNIGGSYTGGTETDGLYEGGTYSGGTDKSFTISSKVKTIQ